MVSSRFSPLPGGEVTVPLSDIEKRQQAVSDTQLLRLAALRSEISGRLWSVTQGMTSSSFDVLIARMAVIQDKYEQRAVLDRW